MLKKVEILPKNLKSKPTFPQGFRKWSEDFMEKLNARLNKKKKNLSKKSEI